MDQILDHPSGVGKYSRFRGREKKIEDIYPLLSFVSDSYSISLRDGPSSMSQISLDWYPFHDVSVIFE